MPLRILHLSDIHFHPGSTWDDDHDIHSELIADLRRVVAELGNIDVVLVGGDIAFSADPAEYAKATEWLASVLIACGEGMEPSHVWTVPGNHDIQRGVIRDSQIVQDFRRALTECEPAAIDVILRRRLVDDPMAQAVMRPLENYNEFASQFGCAITADRPSWEERTLEVDGLELRITGLNSVLTSDDTDSDDPENLSLILGTQQCRLERAAGRVHLAMMHHPPSWIRDWQVVQPYFDRAHIVLFGHEHEFSAEQVGTAGSVRIHAGAVSPERRMEGEVEPWIPSYSVLTLSRVGDQLRVRVDPRKWDIPLTRFAMHPGGSVYFMVDLDPSADSDWMGRPPDEGDEASAVSSTPLISDSAVQTSQEDKMRLRRLSVAFLRLSVSDRRRLGRKLDVLSDDDLVIPSPQLSNLMLERISQNGLIESLEEELNHV